MKTFSFDLWFETEDAETKQELKKLTHHIDYLIDFDNLDYHLNFYDVTVGNTDKNEVGVSGYIDVEENITYKELENILEDAIITDDWNDLELIDMAIFEQTNLEEATAKALEGKLNKDSINKKSLIEKILKEDALNYEDYICIETDDNEFDLFFFDHYLTHGEVDRLTTALNNWKYDLDSKDDFIDEVISKEIPFVKHIQLDDDDIIDIRGYY